MRIAFFKEWSREGWRVRIGEIDKQNRFVPFKLTFERLDPVDEGTVIPDDAFLYLTDFQMKSLIPALSEGLEYAGLMQATSGVVSELKATKYHLEDMRKLALK